MSKYILTYFRNIDEQSVESKSRNHVLPLRFYIKSIWRNTTMPDVDQHGEVHEKVTEFFDLYGQEVLALTAYYNPDWSLREIYLLSNGKEFRKEFFKDGKPF